MFKKMFGAALLCSLLAAPALAQKTPWSLGLSLANPGMDHPFENPPKPGSSSNVNGGYGNISEKDYQVNRYSVEGFIRFSLPKNGYFRLRGGYSLRQTDFSTVLATPDQVAVNRNTIRETSRSWHFAPGFIGTHTMGKFSLEAGLEIPVYFLDRLESYSTWTDLQTPDSEAQEGWRYFPGGVSVGIGPVAGVSFHPIRQVGIGLELRSAWMQTRIKGNYEERSTWTGTPVTTVGTAETYRNNGMSNLQVALQLRFTL